MNDKEKGPKKDGLAEQSIEALRKAFPDAEVNVVSAETDEATDEAEEKCGCLVCSGNPMTVKHWAADEVSILVRQGTNTQGEAELEMVAVAGKGSAPTAFFLAGEQKISQFKAAMRELFV